MERQKKLLSLVLALVMLFTTAVVAVVAEEPTVISTETATVTSSYSMFKVSSVATINTMSDGTKTLDIIYPGTSFLKMYLGSASDAATATTGVYEAQALSDGTYKYTIPMPNSGNTITASVLSSKGSWKDVTITVAPLTSIEKVKISASYSMFKVQETAMLNTYSDGTKTLEFVYTGTSFLKAYLGTAEEAGGSDATATNFYSAKLIDGTYIYTIPMPESGDTITAAVLSSKGSWKDNTITVKYATDTKDVTANIEYDVFSIDQDVTLDVYNDGSMKGAIKYPDSAIAKAYLGTATDAASAEDSALILPVDGKFTIPVSALDTEIAVAVYNGTKWIDTTVIFTTTTDDDTNGGDNTENGNTGGDNTGGANTDVTVTPNVIPSDGTYTIDVTSNNNMFKVVACNLKVVDGKITATVTLSGTGYDKLFLGTSVEAASADSADYIKYVPDANGKYTYTFGIDSLDKPIDVAAYSTGGRSGPKWYDRTLTFDSSTLRLVAEGSTNTNTNTNTSAGTGSSTTTEENKNLSASDIENMLNKADKTEKTSDGTYKPSFGFTGGSGRTSISCNKVVVKDGKATATIVFDSETFTWVQVDGVKYYNQNKGGNSTFVIPVIINDKTPIVAQTVGMSQPHEIEYMLYCFIDGTKAPASTPPIETTTDENTENGKSEDVKDDGNSWGSFDEESVDNEVETGTAENASGISGSLIFIIVAVAFAVGAVAFLVSKKKRG